MIKISRSSRQTLMQCSSRNSFSGRMCLPGILNYQRQSSLERKLLWLFSSKYKKLDLTHFLNCLRTNWQWSRRYHLCGFIVWNSKLLFFNNFCSIFPFIWIYPFFPQKGEFIVKNDSGNDLGTTWKMNPWIIKGREKIHETFLHTLAFSWSQILEIPKRLTPKYSKTESWCY